MKVNMNEHILYDFIEIPRVVKIQETESSRVGARSWGEDRELSNMWSFAR